MLVHSTLTLIFQPRGPNFFLSWMMAWKKHIPNTSLRHVTPRTVTQRQKTNVTGLERVHQLHSLISGMLNTRDRPNNVIRFLRSFFLPFEVFRDRATEDDIKRGYKKSMTWSIGIKCEGSSAILELVLRADLMTCCRTENNNAPLTSTSY